MRSHYFEEEVLPFRLAAGTVRGFTLPTIDAEQLSVRLQVASAAGLVYLFDGDMSAGQAAAAVVAGNEGFVLVAGGGGEPAERVRPGGGRRITLYADAGNAADVIGFYRLRAVRLAEAGTQRPAPHFREEKLPRRSPEPVTAGPPPLAGVGEPTPHGGYPHPQEPV